MVSTTSRILSQDVDVLSEVFQKQSVTPSGHKYLMIKRTFIFFWLSDLVIDPVRR